MSSKKIKRKASRGCNMDCTPCSVVCIMPHRHQLKDLLNRYEPDDTSEKAAKKRMMELLSARNDCFERTALPAHFTGSCWLVNHDGSAALLMHHAKIDKWVQPGGHADGSG